MLACLLYYKSVIMDHKLHVITSQTTWVLYVITFLW